MHLEKNEVHVWLIDLSTDDSLKINVLSADEINRANQFRLPIHKKRFVAARNALRQILSHYICLPAEKILFAYTKHKKPYVDTKDHIEFNLAHSHDKAILAITKNFSVGVDIEKMQSSFDDGVAKRFFSKNENEALDKLTIHQKVKACYRLWSRKEAMIKAAGKGFAISLASFSVSIEDCLETVFLENENWSLLSITAVDSDYQAALASNQNIKKITYWEFFGQKIICKQTDKLAS